MLKINYNDIDPLMRPIIKELNNKGYYTTSCCQGHWSESYQNYFGTYISFKDNIPKDLQPNIDGYPLRPDNINRSRIMTAHTDRFKSNKDKVFYWYGDRHKRITREQKDIEHKRLLNELYKWCLCLPMKRNV